MLQEANQRIIKHMNKDHQLALVDYVVVYGNIKASEIVKPSVHLVEVNETKLVIVYDSTKLKSPQTLSIDWESATEPENKQVTSLKDIKGKLVSMAKYAAAKQGFSHQQITKVLYPRQAIFWYLVFGFLALGMYDVQSLKESFEADPIASKIIPVLPSVTFKVLRFIEKNIAYIFYSLYTIHLGEILFLILPMTIKYRLPTSKKFLWCLMTFFEGVFSYRRFKTLVDDK